MQNNHKLCPICHNPYVINPRTNKEICIKCSQQKNNSMYNNHANSNANGNTNGTVNNSANIRFIHTTCQLCKAENIQPSTLPNTDCIFCGGTSCVKESRMKNFSPQYIIPFQINTEEALKHYKTWIKKQKYISNEFKRNASKLSINAVYMPFWLFDMHARGELGCTGTNNSESNNKSDINNIVDIRRAGEAKLIKYPIHGSTKIDYDLIDEIQPYDYKDVTPFSTKPLVETYVNTPNITIKEAEDKAKKVIECDLHEELMSSIEDFKINDIYHKKCRILYSASYSTLFPVYLINYTYKDQTIQILINGQTGQITGKIPTTPIAYVKWAFKIFVASFTLTLLGGIFIV